MHCACRICYSAHLICVVFLPPIKRRSDIDCNEYLTQKLSVVASCLSQTDRKRQVVFTEYKIPVIVIIAVGSCLAVERVAGAPHSVMEIHNFYSFGFQHFIISFTISSFSGMYIRNGSLFYQAEAA